MSKEMRRYKKMARRHRKELANMVRQGADFDYHYLHELVVTKIKHMYEFYSAGDNVWQSDETRDKVLETLKRAIEINSQLESIWEDNVITDPCGKEAELYREFYAYIGKNIMWWWD